MQDWEVKLNRKTYNLHKIVNSNMHVVYNQLTIGSIEHTLYSSALSKLKSLLSAYLQ